jgi:hypothetical protein
VVAFSFGVPGGLAADYNADRGPSVFDQGMALMDPRGPFAYLPGQRAGSPIYGFLGTTGIPTLSVVPSALAANNIAASQTPIANTALTLVSTTGAGVTVGQSIQRSDNNVTVTGLLALDGPSAGKAFGQGPTGSGGSVYIWDPTTLLARAVRVVSVGNDSTATFTVRGFDIYWYPMVETITGANAGTATGKKAFKYIQSITPAGTLSGSAVTVGTTDIIGLPLRSDYFGEFEVNMNATWITASTGYTVPDATSPATATTGDVRGTYALQTASDGTKRLMLFQSPSVNNISSAVGLFGVTQFTNF